MPTPAEYKERRRTGLCPRCGGARDGELVTCSDCRQGANAAMRDKRQRLKLRGLCGSCGYRKTTKSHRDKCVDYKSNRRKERYGKGLCTRCGESPYVGGFRSCESCLETNRKKRATVRAQVLDHYGRSCACCGEGQPEFLQIDHVNGGGSQHRKECSSTYRWLIDNSFPDEFNTLCANCNVGKHFNGGICPNVAHAGRYKTASHRVLAETVRAEDL